MKRDSVKINHDAPQWSHNPVWNRRYMETKTGYTLRQLWTDSKPAIRQKSSPSYKVKDGDISRAVAAITNLPSSTLPDSPFIHALGTLAAQNAPPQTGTLTQRALEEYWGGPFLRACFFLRFEVQNGSLLCHIVLLQFP